jgi:hypothetical protein
MLAEREPSDWFTLRFPRIAPSVRRTTYVQHRVLQAQVTVPPDPRTLAMTFSGSL